jgi:hypothetical protein
MPATFNQLVTEIPGNPILSAHWNAEFQNIITQLDAQHLSGDGATLSAYQATASPGGLGTEILSSTISDDIKRLRFMLAEITGEAEWYISPSTKLNSKEPGSISNLGMTLSSGVLTVTDASGASLSALNYGSVCVPSTTPGIFSSLKIKSPAILHDNVSGVSDFVGLGFGVTEGVNWANDVPFFIYAVNKSDTDVDGVDGHSVLALSRNPAMSASPADANNIGNTTAIPATDDQTSILIMQNSATPASYVNLPVQLMGAIRMTWAAVGTSWIITALGNSDGFGRAQLSKTFATTWIFPTGQNGAASGKYFQDNGGTAPGWSTQRYYYWIQENGWVSCEAQMTAGTPNGSGAVPLRMSIPTVCNLGPTDVESKYEDVYGSASEVFIVRIAAAAYVKFWRISALLNNSSYVGSGELTPKFSYRAF